MPRRTLRYLLFPVLIFPVASLAQYVPVSGTKVADAGGSLLASGQICFAPTASNGVTTGFHIGGGGFALPRQKCFPVSSGTYSGKLADTALTSPINICYAATVVIPGYPSNTTYTLGSCLQPSATITDANANWCDASGCSTDSYVPSGIETIGPTAPAFISGPLQAAVSITSPLLHGLADSSVSSHKWDSARQDCPDGYSPTHQDIFGNWTNCVGSSYQTSGSTPGVVAQDPAGNQKITLASGAHQYVGSVASESDFDSNGFLSLPGDPQLATHAATKAYVDKLNDFNVYSFGAKGDGITNDTPAFLAAIAAAEPVAGTVVIPASPYGFVVQSSLVVNYSALTNGMGISFEGRGNRGARILCQNISGWCLQYLGTGNEDAQPIRNFHISNIWLSGNSAAGAPTNNASGGIDLNRVEVVTLDNVTSTGWIGTNAHSIQALDFFNLTIQTSQFSNGATYPTGSDVAVFGTFDSGSGDAWNTSNLNIRDSLFQRGSGCGIKIMVPANFMDDTWISGNTFGHNTQGSICGNSTNLRATTIQSNHFESAGDNSTITLATSFVAAPHISLTGAAGVSIRANWFQESTCFICLVSVNSFGIADNQMEQNSTYCLFSSSLCTSSVGINITGTSSANSFGALGYNDIFTGSGNVGTQIFADQSSHVQLGVIDASEDAWGGLYATVSGKTTYKNVPYIKRTGLAAATGNPLDYQGMLFVVDPSFPNPLRINLGNRRFYDCMAIPTSGSWVIGDICKFNSQGAPTSNYTLFGWYRITTGNSNVLGVDWVAIYMMTQPVVVDLGLFPLPTSAIEASNCVSLTPSISSNAAVAGAGVVVTPTVDSSTVAGYGPGSDLRIKPWVTSGVVNIKVCNYGATSVTPGALSVNVQLLP